MHTLTASFSLVYIIMKSVGLVCFTGSKKRKGKAESSKTEEMWRGAGAREEKEEEIHDSGKCFLLPMEGTLEHHTIVWPLQSGGN